MPAAQQEEEEIGQLSQEPAAQQEEERIGQLSQEQTSWMGNEIDMGQHQPPPAPPAPTEGGESPSQMHACQMYAPEML